MVNANGSLKAEVVKAVKEHPDLTHAQIGELFDVPGYQVASWAHAAGIFRRKPSAPSVETASLDNKIRQAEQQLSELKRLRALTVVRFEREGSKVAVYGLSAQPLVAEYKEWLRFLRENGAAMLREFIQKQFGSMNGSGMLQ